MPAYEGRTARHAGSSRRRATSGMLALVIPLTLAACGSQSASDGRGRSADSSAPSTGPRQTVRPPTRAGDGTFRSEDFRSSTAITNPWLPLVPGVQTRFEGMALEDGEHVRHAIVSTVTNLTKEIDGVRTRVVWERDYSKGEMVEEELSFYAQDEQGTVWYLGEYPEEYDGGKVVDAPAWLSGLQGGRAGIAMQADPRTGRPSYAQGWGPKVGWTDRAFVKATGQRVCVPVGCYKDVLVTAEAAQDEKNSHQLKYYARGVGNVHVGWDGQDETQEVLDLVRRTKLSPAELSAADATSLAMEKRAYARSKDVYARTAHANSDGGGGG